MSVPLTLTSLPLLPISSVLFPGSVLSLNVLKARYLDMVRKCHQINAPFGAVAVASDHEEYKAKSLREYVHNIGTLAVVNQLVEHRPGLLHVRCQGMERFRILNHQVLPHGLWTANVEHLPTDAHVPVPYHLQRVAQALARAGELLYIRGFNVTSYIELSTSQFEDCGWVANRWCELLPISAEIKQQLMQLESPLVRLEFVARILGRMGITAA